MRVNDICQYNANHGEREDGDKHGEIVEQIVSPFLVTSTKGVEVDTPKGKVTVTLASGYVFHVDGSGSEYVEDVPPAGGPGHKDGDPGYTG